MREEQPGIPGGEGRIWTKVEVEQEWAQSLGGLIGVLSLGPCLHSSWQGLQCPFLVAVLAAHP